MIGNLKLIDINVRYMNIKGNLGGIVVGDDEDTRLMSIINLSPRSFYKRSIKQSEEEIQTHLEQINTAGADCIDVGAISSAPAFLYNSEEVVSNSTEIERLSEFFRVYKEVGASLPISIDTQSSKIADYALSQGATIINDISGFKSDPKLPQVIADHGASVILMACRKIPGDVYKIGEIITELRKSLQLGHMAGIKASTMIIDPGLGAWVSQRQMEDDYLIISQLKKLRNLNHCILVGISRKSFIGEILNVPPEKRLWGSLAATTIAVLHGAHIIRTHDIKATKDVCIITDFVKKLGKNVSS